MADTCEQALRRILENRMDSWQGLPECSIDALERVLGPGPGPPDGAAIPGGEPLAFRAYPQPRELAPYGVTVWLAGDAAVALQINSPALPRPPLDVFGQPEHELPSLLGSALKQWVYPRRGLALHLNVRSGQTRRLYAFAPMSGAEYEASWLSRVSARRVPLRVSKEDER